VGDGGGEEDVKARSSEKVVVVVERSWKCCNGSPCIAKLAEPELKDEKMCCDGSPWIGKVGGARLEGCAVMVAHA
jgi:hypothetical protein